MVLFWIKAALMKGWSHPTLGSLSIPRAVPGKGTQHTHSACTSLLVLIRSEGKLRIVILWNDRIPRMGGTPWWEGEAPAQKPQHLVPLNSSFCRGVSKQALAKPVFLSLNFPLHRKLHTHSYSCPPAPAPTSTSKGNMLCSPSSPIPS